MSFITALVCFSVLTLMMLSIEILFTYATQGFAFGFSSSFTYYAHNSVLASQKVGRKTAHDEIRTNNNQYPSAVLYY